MTTDEVWKLIENTSYYVSSHGRVRGPRTILKPAISNSGYLLVCLYSRRQPNEKRNETKYLHRLIAEAFIPNDNPARTMVNHKDRNKMNNSIENLEWVTPSENVSHWRDETNIVNVQVNLSRLIRQINQLDQTDQEDIKMMVKMALNL